MSDYLRKFLFEDLPVKGALVHLHSSWADVIKRAKPPQDTLSLLGETVCASVLLTSNIKFEGSVSLQIQSNGNIRLLLGQCTNDHLVRGVVRVAEDDEPDSDRLPVLTINLEPDDGGEPYQGIVSLDSRGLAESLHEYFNMSEQLPTHFVLAAGPTSCSGLMLQKMPGELEDEDTWNRLLHLASTLSQEELQGLDAQTILHRIFNEDSVRLFDPETVEFGCSCSEDRVAGMLKGLGVDEAWSIIEERGDIEVRCEYCGEQYSFDPVDVAQLFTPDAALSPEEPGVQ